MWGCTKCMFSLIHHMCISRWLSMGMKHGVLLGHLHSSKLLTFGREIVLQCFVLTPSNLFLLGKWFFYLQLLNFCQVTLCFQFSHVNHHFLLNQLLFVASTFINIFIISWIMPLHLHVPILMDFLIHQSINNNWNECLV